MASHQIICINKLDRDNPFERIEAVGVLTTDGGYLQLSHQDVIDLIDFGQGFYVEVNGVLADVIVAKSRFGNDYIKTEADGEDQNNLLSLKECE